MSQIVIGVVIAVISAIIISLFRIGGNQNVSVHHVQGTRGAGTLWKLMIVLGWIMFIGGVYYGLAWASTNGWSDPRPAMGLSSAVLGFFIVCIGKFGAWWNRN